MLQRVYTDDRRLDEVMAAPDRSVVLVPEGYHPVGAPHGYESYYLNVMAGPKWSGNFTMILIMNGLSPADQPVPD